MKTSTSHMGPVSFTNITCIALFGFLGFVIATTLVIVMAIMMAMLSV